jgi:hypothetical protein
MWGQGASLHWQIGAIVANVDPIPHLGSWVKLTLLGLPGSLLHSWVVEQLLGASLVPTWQHSRVAEQLLG